MKSDTVTEASVDVRGIRSASPPADEEVLKRARSLAQDFAASAVERDRDRRYPVAELKRLAASGLLGLIVPARYGGPGISHAVAVRAIAMVAGADASLGQLFVSNYTAIGYILATGTEEQKRHFLGRIAGGARFGNASAEAGGRPGGAFSTRALRDGDEYVVSGRKIYSTGAIDSDVMSIVCVNDAGEMMTVIADTNAPGITIIDDWDGFGQRTTASGTTIIENLRVPVSHAFYASHRPPTALLVATLPFLVHAAIDQGIAEAAVLETVRFVRERSRPFAGAGVDKASKDPHVLGLMGELQTRLHASELLVDRAARLVDRAVDLATEEAVAAASIAVSEARISSTEIALEASTRMFQLAGTSATRGPLGLDRYWRDARTHTVHDPVHWHAHVVGDFYLNDAAPTR